MFRPDMDVDEFETREDEHSLDWVYEHWVDVPVATDQTAHVWVRLPDHDLWFGRIFLVDRDGASIVYWSDAETVAHWRDTAELEYGIGGIAMWTVGQEDTRTWERLADGELPPGTKRYNS